MVKSKDILPTSSDIKPHLLHLLYSQNKMHRSCTTNIAYDYIAEKLGLTSKDGGLVYSDGRNKWELRIQATKAQLKAEGFVKDKKVEGAKNRSLWSITKTGERYYEQSL